MEQSSESSASRIMYYGYKLFESEQKKRLRQQYPEHSLLKRIREMWRSMTEAQQIQWGERARAMAYGQQQMVYPNFVYPPAHNDSVQSRMQSSAHPQNFPQPVSAVTNEFANIASGVSNPWAMPPQGSHHGMQRSIQGGNSAQMHSMSNQQPTTTSLTAYSASRGASQGMQPQTQTDQTSSAMQPFSMQTFPGMSQSRVPALPPPYQPNPPSCMQQENNNGVMPYSPRSPAAVVQQHQRPQSFGNVNQMMHFGQRFSAPRAPSSSALMPCRQQFPRIPLNHDVHTRQVQNQRMGTYPSGHGQHQASSSHGSNRLAIQANLAPSQPTLNMADVFDTTPAPRGQAYKEIIIEVNGVKQTILVPTANNESNSSGNSSKSAHATNSGNTHTSPRAQRVHSGAGHSSSSSVSPRSSIGASISPSHSSTEIRRAEKRSHHSSSSSSAASGSSKHTGSSSTSPGAHHAKHSRNASQDDDTLPAAKDDVSKLTAGMSNQVRELLNGMFTKSGSSSKNTSTSENPKITTTSQSPGIPNSSPDLPTTSGTTQAPSRDRFNVPVSLPVSRNTQLSPQTSYGMQSSANASANNPAQPQNIMSNMLGTAQVQRHLPNVPPLTNCTTASAVPRSIHSVINTPERHSSSFAPRQHSVSTLEIMRPGFGNIPPLRHLPQENRLSQVPEAVPLSVAVPVHTVRKEVNTGYPGYVIANGALSSVHDISAESRHRGITAADSRHREIDAANSKHGMVSNSVSSSHHEVMSNSIHGMMTNSVGSYHGLFTSRAHSDFGAISSAIHEPVPHSASADNSVLYSSSNMMNGAHPNATNSNPKVLSNRNYFSNGLPAIENHTLVPNVALVSHGVHAASESQGLMYTTARAHQGVIQKAMSDPGAIREILNNISNISYGSVAESWKLPSPGVVDNNNITTSKYGQTMMFPGSNDVQVPLSDNSGISHGGTTAMLAQKPGVISSNVPILPPVPMLSPIGTTDKIHTSGTYMPPVYPPRVAANHTLELPEQLKSNEAPQHHQDHVQTNNSLSRDSVVISSEKETGAIVLTIRNRSMVETEIVSEKATTPRAKLRPDFQSSSLPADSGSYLTEQQPALPPRAESPSMYDLNSANTFVNRVPDVNIPSQNIPQNETTESSSLTQKDTTPASEENNLTRRDLTPETEHYAALMNNPIDNLCQVAIKRLDTSLVQRKTVLLSEVCDPDLGVSSLYDEAKPSSSGLNRTKCSDDLYVPEHDTDSEEQSEDEMDWQPLKRKRVEDRRKGKKYRRIMTMSERNSRRIVDSDSETNEEYDWLVSSSSSEEDDNEMCSKRQSSRAAAKAAKSAIGQLISLETATTPTKSPSRELLQLQDYWSIEKRAERGYFNEDETKRLFNVKNCCVMLRRLDIGELPKRVI